MGELRELREEVKWLRGRWEEDRLYGTEGGRDEEDGGDVGGEGY